MADDDVYPIVGDYAIRKYNYIIGKIEGKNVDYQLDEHTLKTLKRGVISSVFSLELKYSSQGKDQKTKKILIKYFDKRSDSKRKVKFKNFAESTKNTCNFLSGGKDFPTFYFFENDAVSGGDFLGLEQIGDKTLHEISENYDHDNMLNLIQGILPHMIRFQINSTKNLESSIKNGEMKKETYESIFKKRDSIERLLDYSRAIKGIDNIDEIDRDLRRKIIKLSVPILKIYEPRKDTFRVTHGDPIFKNIVLVDEDKKKYGFIDAEPTIGDGLLDLGALLATPNINLSPADWDFLTEIFLLTNERELENSRVNLNSTRSKLVSKLEDWGVKFSKEEPPGNYSFYVIGTIFSRCARISAKVNDLKRYDPDKYREIQREDPNIVTTIEDMKKNMSLALWEIVTAPNKFEISKDEYVNNLTELYEILGNEGVIERPEKYFRSNGNKQKNLRAQDKNRQFRRDVFDRKKYIFDKEKTRKPEREKEPA